MRAIIVLAVLLALAIASKASGPRGGDLGAARMTSEIPVAKKKPTIPRTGKPVVAIEQGEPPGGGAEADGLDDVEFGPEDELLPEGGQEVDDTPPDAVELQVMELLIRTKRRASRGVATPDTRSVREMSVHNIATALHRVLMLNDERELAAMTRRAVSYLDAHATFIDGTNLLTPQEFYEHLIEFVPSIVGQAGQPTEATCARLASLIELGRRASKEVEKLDPWEVRSTLLRELIAKPLPLDATPDELVKRVLRAAGLSRDFVNNRLDAAERMRKSREAPKEQPSAAKAPGATARTRPPRRRS